MKTVKFVSRIEIEERPLIDRKELLYAPQIEFYPAGPGGIPAYEEDQCYQLERCRIIDIHKKLPDGSISSFCVAYSQEVQKLLNLPIDVILDSNERIDADNETLKSKNKALRSELDEINNYSFFERIAFVFTGRKTIDR